jgi:alkanesulfonate monooxygenase SsuD/methylene tetrahydromethanopterin reductase-like flavin-dependent oxidoreductase (luciferase family)
VASRLCCGGSYDPLDQWGAGSDATARWAAQRGMNLMSSTLKDDESGEPFHVQQRKQIEAFAEHVAPALGWQPHTAGLVEGYEI